MEDELLKQTSVALRKAALNEEAKEFLLANPILFKLVKKAASRYIGGEVLAETVEKVKTQNANGFKCSIEFMGESTRTKQEADQARDEFVRICREIKNNSLNSTLSLDLSHIGLAVSRDLCLENLNVICEEALNGKIEVTISAEGTDRTDAVLDAYRTIVKSFNNVAITLQAYLHRTKDDFNDLIKLNGRIRMVKGAFETPPGLSLPRGRELDNVYLSYVDQLLSMNHLCAIATHDSDIQQRVKTLIETYKVPKTLYEYESLYGIQHSQLDSLRIEGHPAKIYFVYGKEWYLYLCNRLAEHPINLLRALNDIVD